MFVANRNSGLEALTQFLPRAGRHYAANRNSDLGPDKRENVSSLSPWVRHRLVSEAEIIRETLKKHSFSASEKFIQEVFWRAYFKGWLEQRPDVWRWYCEDLRHELSVLEKDKSLNQRYQEAVNSQTSIECFDVWASELIETGYLHNHARMWFASIWIFTLQLPWVLGADFFLRHLLDGDPASNTCSWRWVAGLHTKGKNYVARASNIEKFTGGRFNPWGQLNEAPLPLSEDREAPLIGLQLSQQLPSGPYILLVHEEDCLPEQLDLQNSPEMIVAISSNEHRSPLATAELVQRFTQSAIEDGLQRGQSHFKCPGLNLMSRPPIEAILEAHRETGILNFVTPDIPVGPLADTISQNKNRLVESEIKLTPYTSPYYQACWPHATRGFFKLKQKLPTIINTLGL